MPNRCWNTLIVEPAYLSDQTEDDRDQVMKHFQEVLNIDKPALTNFRPMPEVYANTVSGSRSFKIDGEEVNVTTWIVDKETGEDRPLNDEEALATAEFTNWYEWSRIHWGTKWGDYDTEIVENTLARMEIKYNTAWGPPNELLQYIADTHRVSLLNQWHEEGGGHGSSRF